jgi:hypothetical protein
VRLSSRKAACIFVAHQAPQEIRVRSTPIAKLLECSASGAGFVRVRCYVGPIAGLWRRKDADARGDSRRRHYHQSGREESSTGKGNGKRGCGDFRAEMRGVPRRERFRRSGSHVDQARNACEELDAMP